MDVTRTRRPLLLDGNAHILRAPGRRGWSHDPGLTITARMAPEDDDLLHRVERLKIACEIRATGNAGPDHARDYAQVRQELLEDGRFRQLLPEFLKARRTLEEFWAFIKPKFGRYHERREYLTEQFARLFAFLESRHRSPADAEIAVALLRLDADHVHEAWDKALARRATDPDGAITMARTLVESVCKTILDDLGEPYDAKAELPTLYNTVAKKLALAPTQHELVVIKEILGGCYTVVNGLASIRNRMSDAHGQGKKPLKATPRHAQLAVNVAGSLAMFLVETHEERKNAGP